VDKEYYRSKRRPRRALPAGAQLALRRAARIAATAGLPALSEHLRTLAAWWAEEAGRGRKDRRQG
jgi:hypothetical protein